MKVVKVTEDGDELTRYGFISHMEDYIKQLLSDPIHAKVGDYLGSHGIDGPGILQMLLDRDDQDDSNSAILVRTEKIKTDPETGKDRFCIKYKLPRQDYDKKMRNLFIKLFEDYRTDNDMLNEDGATSCCSVTPMNNALGDVSIPLQIGGKKDSKKTDSASDIIRRDMPSAAVKENRHRTVYFTEDQINECLREEVESTGMGGGFDFGYAANALNKTNDEVYDHKDICKDKNLSRDIKRGKI